MTRLSDPASEHIKPLSWAIHSMSSTETLLGILGGCSCPPKQAQQHPPYPPQLPPTSAKASAVPRGTIVALSLYALHQNAKMNSQLLCAFFHFLPLFQTQCTTSFVYLLSGHFSLPFPPTSKRKHGTSVPFCLAGMASRPGGKGAVNAP